MIWIFNIPIQSYPFKILIIRASINIVKEKFQKEKVHKIISENLTDSSSEDDLNENVSDDSEIELKRIENTIDK